MNLEYIQQFLLYEFKSESELIKEINLLSENFTSNREEIEKYLKSEKSVSAYVCFYLLTNIPKLNKSFDLMKLDFSFYKDWEIFDIGAGPATFSIALLNHYAGYDIKAIEKSDFMQRQGEKLVSGMYPNSNFEYIANDLIGKKSKKRLGIFGHSANEMGTDKALAYIDKLNLDEVILIEPGTKDFFKTFIEIRSALLERSYFISYPCSSQSSCPMKGDDWCHQILDLYHGKDVQRLGQMAKKDRNKSPISMGHFTKEPLSVNEAMIIRVYPHTKFSLEWQVCYHKDGQNTIIDLQIPFKGILKSRLKELKAIRAGERVSFEITRHLTDNKFRGLLK